MIYEGKAVNNITLTPNEMSTIKYIGYGFYADIINNGPGTIYVKWDGEPYIGDPNSLTLKEGQGYEIRVSLVGGYGDTINLNIIGANESWVQVAKVVK